MLLHQLICDVFNFRWCALTTSIKLDENLTDESFYRQRFIVIMVLYNIIIIYSNYYIVHLIMAACVFVVWLFHISWHFAIT